MVVHTWLKKSTYMEQQELISCGSMVDTPVLACLPVVVGEGKSHNKAASSCWPDTERHNENMLICLLFLP